MTNPIQIIHALSAIVGSEHLIYGDQEKMAPYSHDEVADRSYARMPAYVVKPGSAAEIAAIMKLANREKIPVTPRGAGSGLSGGAVPVSGGILLSTERLNRILEIDRDNLIAVLEPGVVTSDFNRQLEKEGLFFAGYPMSQEVCSIGGNVAENAGGGRAVKYGVTARYITGLEVVMPTGEICAFGGKRVKDVTGYNMIGILVGSEGTLGIFTRIYIRLLPLPRARIDMMVIFKDIRAAIGAVPEIITRLRVIPAGLEFMDRLTLETTTRYLREKLPHDHCGAILIIELDGNDSDTIRRECLDIGDFCLDQGALDAFIAEGPSDQARIWRIRQHAAEALKAFSAEQSLEDIVVPINKIPLFIESLAELSRKYDVLIPCYGHAGDGNLHATVIKKPDSSLEQWPQVLPLVLEELYKTAADLGGTISGEHGIGHKRKKYLPLVMSEAEIEAMRSIKRALDPNNILNPGKIFDF
jgi:glycolate oxidase